MANSFFLSYFSLMPFLQFSIFITFMLYFIIQLIQKQIYLKTHTLMINLNQRVNRKIIIQKKQIIDNSQQQTKKSSQAQKVKNRTETMSSFFNIFRRKQPVEAPKKLNITTVFNSNVEVEKATNNSNLSYNCSQKRLQAYENILNQDIVNIQKLKQLAWDGVPVQHRSKCWKILLKYLPTNSQNIQQTLARKRKDYFVMVDTYIEHPTLERDAQEQKIFKLIIDDVNRTLPQSTLIRHQLAQKLLRKVLYVWHMRHPASGYVQGINDIVTPFFIVFLSDYIQLNFDTLQLPQDFNKVTAQQLACVQADCYWCLCKVLDHILDNYTSSWPGITKSFGRLKQVINRVDSQLLKHFEQKQIDFYHMYFKWVTCLLLRQFSVKTGLRLFDTYIADQNNYFAFSLYILAAIILKYSKKFKKMNFEQMMIFQQNMPTKQWSQQDLATVIAEAYVYQSYFTTNR